MTRKTYGVSGLMDWAANIKAGKATVNVHFTGGALTAYGVTPATYSTTNPLFQIVIENSDYFKNGRIHLLSEIEVAGSAPKKQKGLSMTETSGENTHEVDGLKEVEVVDKNDAIEYLKENYPDKGYGAVKLRTKSAFDAACAEHGIKFVFTT